MVVKSENLQEVVDQNEGLGRVLGVSDSLIDKLEDDGFEVEMVDRCGLDLTSELNIVGLVRFIKNKFGQVTFGRGVLSLDFFIHFLETNDNEP